MPDRPDPSLIPLVRRLAELMADGSGAQVLARMQQLALLSSPAFLFRIERDPVDAKPGSIYRLGDLEVASRLSFFLWKSIPDDELLNVAARGRLIQAGLYPNPTFVWEAEDVGSADKAAGKQGPFLGQEFITCHKRKIAQAAAAHGVGARVATGNPKDFRFPGLQVEHWPVGE